MNTNEVTTEKLLSDLKTVMRDAEELLRATAGELGEKAQAARERLGVAVESAKASCRRLEEKAVEGARRTDELVREHPYEALGIAFGIGLVIGALLNRR